MRDSVASAWSMADVSTLSFCRSMAAVCSTAAKLKSPVIIRWGQEMDETDSQFSWSHWQGADYAKAYRRMVEVCKVHLKTAKYMQ